MTKPYVMKDLGYPRTPTTDWMIIESEDGQRKAIPVQAIVDNRDENYQEELEDTIGYIKKGQLDNGEIQDWAGNNMNFDDVEEFAVNLPPVPQPPPDWQDVWNSSDMKIVKSI